MDILLQNWWLVPATFFASILTAVSGAGGGVLMLGLIGLVLPPAAVVPIHGAVMAPQNGWRALLLKDYIDWNFLAIAGGASLVGALLAGSFAMQLPDRAIQAILGVGLLYLVWAPKPKKVWDFPGKIIILAFFMSIISMLIGAAGILFSAVRKREGRAKEGVLADQSALMLIQHGSKALVFGLFGFAYGPYIWLLSLMILVGLLGTWVGVKTLKKMNNIWFDRVFKVSVSAVAMWILVRLALEF